MTFNIALNTIIYIMVFLFPGILFRRFYYLGSDKNQFNHGHLLERFLITILLSIIVLASFFLVNNYLNKEYSFSLVFDYSYQDFVCLFSNLGSNIIPPIFYNYNKFENFIKTFGILYLYSSFCGWFFYNIIKITHLDNWISVLRFSNEWQYLLTLPERKVVKRKPFQKLNAQMDLLTHDKFGDVLYQGFYHSLVLNKDNEIDSIVLTNPKKFIEIQKTEANQKKIEDIEESIGRGEFIYYKYRDYENKVIYKKHINSHSFVISKKDIININLLYIKDINLSKKNVSKLVIWLRCIKVIQFIFLASLIVFPFLDVNLPSFNTFWNRLFFSVVTFIELRIFISILSYLLKSKYIEKREEKRNTYLYFFFMLSFGAFYLSVFGFIHVIFSLFIWLLILFILSVIYSNDKNEKKD